TVRISQEDPSLVIAEAWYDADGSLRLGLLDQDGTLKVAGVDETGRLWGSTEVAHDVACMVVARDERTALLLHQSEGGGSPAKVDALDLQTLRVRQSLSLSHRWLNGRSDLHIDDHATELYTVDDDATIVTTSLASGRTLRRCSLAAK